MDLRHHIRVWWRFRAVVLGGLGLAIVVAVLASFKLGFANGLDVQWRSQAVYTSTSRLFVTQPGFPWGRVTLPGTVPGEPVPDSERTRVFATPDRFSNLAIVYSYIAQSDQVRKLIASRPVADQIQVTPAYTAGGEALPLLEVATLATHPIAAQQLNDAVVEGLREYLANELNAADVPAAERVSLQVLNPPEVGVLTSGRTPTLSAVAFVLIAIATFALIYVLENLSRTAMREEYDAPDHRSAARAVVS
jgi:hypothetical protein